MWNYIGTAFYHLSLQRKDAEEVSPTYEDVEKETGPLSQPSLGIKCLKSGKVCIVPLSSIIS